MAECVCECVCGCSCVISLVEPLWVSRCCRCTSCYIRPSRGVSRDWFRPMRDESNHIACVVIASPRPWGFRPRRTKIRFPWKSVTGSWWVSQDFYWIWSMESMRLTRWRLRQIKVRIICPTLLEGTRSIGRGRLQTKITKIMGKRIQLTNVYNPAHSLRNGKDGYPGFN